jgi:hypothetical protein
MRLLWIFLATVILFTSCAHIGALPADVLLRDPISITSPETLVASEVLQDIEFLKDVFASGYIGFHFQPPKIQRDFESDLKDLALHSVDPKTFCSGLAKAFAKFPDNHLEVYRNGKSCLPSLSTPLKPVNTAENGAPKEFWKMSWMKTHGRLIPVLGILKFPDPNDSGWDGFKKTFLELVSKPVGIIDLRGNSGGHLGMGAWMAASLGLKDASPWEKAWDLRSAEANAILRNGLILKRKRYADVGEPVPEWLEAQLHEPLSVTSKSLVAVPRNTILEPSKPYRGKLLILTDRECGSTCEATILLLKKIPTTKLVGENTSGTYGYGNAGRLVLLNSKIVIQIPTRAFVHTNDVYEEKRGIIPDIKISREAALKAALEIAIR